MHIALLLNQENRVENGEATQDQSKKGGHIMLLILQIALTVSAWRKGWRAWALLPVGLLMMTGFILGAASGTADVFAAYGPILILGDIACAVVLAIMATHPPQRHVSQAGHRHE